MKKIISKIVKYEESFGVNLLHKALRALDLPVNEEETHRSIAGDHTVARVEELQQRFNIPARDDVLVDAETSAALGDALARTGHMDSDRAYVVSGKVIHDLNTCRMKLTLMAFDLDLKGVAVYRKVRSLAEIANRQHANNYRQRNNGLYPRRKQ